jgi:hypothetical protein
VPAESLSADSTPQLDSSVLARRRDTASTRVMSAADQSHLVNYIDECAQCV